MTKMAVADLPRWCDLAEQAARKAGAELARCQAEWSQVESSVGHDLKIAADRHAERIIVDVLRAGSPFELLSEEAGFIAANSSDARWVVDPLDGSVNYNLGIPLCCVSIALVLDDRPLLGVVYDFNRDELFAGGQGLGVRCNGVAIHVSTTAHRSEAVLGCGFPSYSDHSTENLSRLVGNIQSYKKVRALGSAALTLAYVACGKLDAYFEEDIQIWDIAAGAALVEAAGGKVSMQRRDAAGHRVILLADNGRLNEAA
jgi:myo-inositol-1(or 4)-monophosphatase